MPDQPLTNAQQRMFEQVKAGKVQRHQTGAGIVWLIAEAKATGPERRVLDALARIGVIELHGFAGGSHSRVTVAEPNA